MKTPMTIFAAAAIGLSLTVPATANPATVKRVTEGLITAGMAIELGDRCTDVGVRYIRGISFLQGLKNHLKDLGYSASEIDAYIDNKTERQRLEGIAQDRLRALGVTAGDAASYCVVARGQMNAGTPVGRLLR